MSVFLLFISTFAQSKQEINMEQQALYPNLIREVLTSVTYPATRQNLVEAGMVGEDIVISGRSVRLTLIFPRDTDPFIRSVVKSAEATLKLKLGQDLQVEILTEYRSQPRPTEDKLLPEVANIIAVSSGKGGVGKSTIAVNLAVALAQLGYRVGLLDTDIFGPSQTKMMGVEQVRPYGIEKDGRQLIEPVEQYGVKMLSIGFFVKPETATLWRGGMASNALKQLIADADWGALDYLILDTPPGTSDIHLTLLQTLAITGAIIVSTPQDVALADARKGIDMYQNEKVNVPILGLIENMAWFTPAELPDNRYYIFGKEGGKRMAEELNVPLLAQVPLVMGIREGGDNGQPAVLQTETASAQLFLSLAQKVVTLVRRRNQEQPKTQRVETK